MRVAATALVALLPVAVLAGLDGGAGATRSAAATAEYVRPCWHGPHAHPWPFDHRRDPERRKAGNSPACRVTPGKRIYDRTPRGAIELAKQHRKLLKGAWPVLDSLGGEIATIQMLSHGRWTIKAMAQDETWTARSVVILVKGRVCAHFEGMSRYIHVRISVRSPARAELGFGGLIARAALPTKPGRAATGCGTRVLGPPLATIPVAAQFGLAGTGRHPTYISERASKGKSPTRVRKLPGEGLRNYFHEPYRSAELAVSTTAVEGGGYVRAILSWDMMFDVHDSFAYADPNRPCTATDGVIWSYGRVFAPSHPFEAWGWLPRLTAVAPRPCEPPRR